MVSDGLKIKPVELGTEEEYKKYVLKISKNVDICTVVGFGRAGKDGTKVYKDNVCIVVLIQFP